MKPVHVLILGALVGVAALLYVLSDDDGMDRDGRRAERARPGGARSGSTRSVPSKVGAGDAAEVATGTHELELHFRAGDGSSVESVELTIVDPLGHTSTQTGLGETFLLSGIAPGVYRFMARDGAAVGAKTVLLREPKESHTVDLREAIRVMGRVVDERNEPIAGALVEGVRGMPKLNGMDMTELLRRLGSPDDAAASTTTGSDGRYTLLLPGAGSYSLRARTPRHGQEGDNARDYTSAVDGVDFMLFPAAVVSGRVMDEHGQPIAGVQIYVTNMVIAFTGIAPKAETVTDAEGRFLLPVSTEWAGEDIGAMLTARAPGYSVKIEAQFKIPSKDLVIVLERGATLTMRLMDASRPGAPASGVAVSVFAPNGFASGMSDAGGYVRIANLPSLADGSGGELSAMLSSREYVPQLIDLEGRAPVDGELAAGEIVLARGGTIRGVVRDAETKEPVSGANVQTKGGLGMELAMLGMGGTVSDENGRFELRGVSLEAPVVFARHPDYAAPGMVSFTALFASDEDQAPLFEEGKTEIEMDLLLVRGATVDGTVSGPDGNPVAGAKVVVRLDEDEMELVMLTGGGFPTAISRADGTYAIKALTSGQTVNLIASHPDFGTSAGVSIRAENGASVELRLRAPWRISGRVLDVSGNAVAGARVRLSPQDDESEIGSPMDDMGMSGVTTRPGITNDDGQFTLHNVARIPSVLSVSHPLFLEHTQEIQPDSGAATELRAIALKAGLRLSGVLFDPDGKPLAGVDLSASFEQEESDAWVSPATAKTDKDGVFVFYALAPGAYSVDATKRGYFMEDRIAVAGAEGLTLRMVKASKIAGRVLANGMPVEKARVIAKRGEGLRRWARTGKDGKFVMEEMPPGAVVTIKIQHRDYLDFEVKNVPSDAAERTFTLDEGRVVRGEVVDENGKPVAGADVKIDAEDGSDSGQSVTDKNGKFRVSALGDGALTASVSKSGRESVQRRNVEIAAGATTVRIVAQKGYSISGRISAPKNVSLRSINVAALDAEGEEVGDCWTRGSTGNFVIFGLPAGTYRIVATRYEQILEEISAPTVAADGIVTGATDIVLTFEK